MNLQPNGFALYTANAKAMRSRIGSARERPAPEFFLAFFPAPMWPAACREMATALESPPGEPLQGPAGCALVAVVKSFGAHQGEAVTKLELIDAFRAFSIEALGTLAGSLEKGVPLVTGGFLGLKGQGPFLIGSLPLPWLASQGWFQEAQSLVPPPPSIHRLAEFWWEDWLGALERLRDVVIDSANEPERHLVLVPRYIHLLHEGPPPASAE